MNQEQELMWQGRNLVLAAVFGLIVMIGTLFDILGWFKSSGHGRPPIIPLHEWYVDEGDGNDL